MCIKKYGMEREGGRERGREREGWRERVSEGERELHKYLCWKGVDL